MAVNHRSNHAKNKILLPILGRVLLSILLQLQAYPAVVSMIDASTALVDIVMMHALKIYVYTIPKKTHGIESTSTQLQAVK